MKQLEKNKRSYKGGHLECLSRDVKQYFGQLSHHFTRERTSRTQYLYVCITKITNPDTLSYYLDDDNIIHLDLCNLLDNNTIYSFNQNNRIQGNNINVGYIDTAMVIIPFNLCKNIKGKLDIYEADMYI